MDNYGDLKLSGQISGTQENLVTRCLVYSSDYVFNFCTDKWKYEISQCTTDQMTNNAINIPSAYNFFYEAGESSFKYDLDLGTAVTVSEIVDCDPKTECKIIETTEPCLSNSTEVASMTCSFDKNTNNTILSYDDSSATSKSFKVVWSTKF